EAPEAEGEGGTGACAVQHRVCVGVAVGDGAADFEGEAVLVADGNRPADDGHADENVLAGGDADGELVPRRGLFVVAVPHAVKAAGGGPVNGDKAQGHGCSTDLADAAGQCLMAARA